MRTRAYELSGLREAAQARSEAGSLHRSRRRKPHPSLLAAAAPLVHPTSKDWSDGTARFGIREIPAHEVMQGDIVRLPYGESRRFGLEVLDDPTRVRDACNFECMRLRVRIMVAPSEHTGRLGEEGIVIYGANAEVDLLREPWLEEEKS